MSASPSNSDVEAGSTPRSHPLGFLNFFGLNHINLLNIFFFVLNVLVTYGVGTMGWFGAPTNQQLSDKYQTLVTPNATAFSIWAVIFLSQAVFTVIQALPTIRSSEMVQRGVGYQYILTCIFQAGWTVAFALESMAVSLLFMVGIWLSLLTLVYNQYNIKSDGSMFEFWFLRFPFCLHCGWITAATALNLNVLFVARGASAALQLAVAIVSLAALHAFSVWVLFYLSKPNYTLAAVLAWASWWIHVELQSPQSLIVSTFSTDAISGVGYAASGISVIILTQIAIRVFTNSMDLLKDDSSMVYSSGLHHDTA